MEHSSFAIDILANMDEASRVIALEAADDYLWFQPGDIAVLAGFWKAQAFLADRHLEQVSGVLKEIDENQKKVKEFDKVRDIIREAKDEINAKLVAYGSKKIKDASNRGKAAANALHDKPNRGRAKRAAIQAAWASGKYSSRDICAEQECAGLNMSPSTARKALINTPNPA